MLKDLRTALPLNDPVAPPNVDICYTNNLPPELLSRIFEVGSTEGASIGPESGDEEKTEGEGDSGTNIPSVTSIPFRHVPFQILVSHVCHHWRAVACSTPSLWATIKVNPEARQPYERVSMLLERSNGHLIDISIQSAVINSHKDCDKHDGMGCDLAILLSMLTPHIHRWRTATVSVWSYFQMESFLSAVSDSPSILAAPQLAELNLSLDDFIGRDDPTLLSLQDRTFFGGSIPLLTKLVLRSMPVNWNQPWITSASNLRVLELSHYSEYIRPSWAQFVSILRGAPGLEELNLHRSGPSGDPAQWFIKPTADSPADLNSPIQLLHVIKFILAIGSETRAVELLRRLYLPALKKLFLGFHRSDCANLVRELARPVTSPSPSPEQPHSLLGRLRSLTIWGPCQTEHIRTLYGGLQQLTTLHLSWAPVAPFLEILCAPCTLSGHGDTWLPRLAALIVDEVGWDILCRLVRRRREAGGGSASPSLTSVKVAWREQGRHKVVEEECKVV